MTTPAAATDRGRALTGLSGVAWAATGLGAASATVSFYWAFGGEHGLDLLGGQLETETRDGGGHVVALLAAAGLLKVLVCVSAILATRPQPRGKAVLTARAAAWVAAVVLLAYGAGLVVLQSTVLVLQIVGVLPDASDRRAFLAHLLLWDPWFLLWGACLLVALRGTRTPK